MANKPEKYLTKTFGLQLTSKTIFYSMLNCLSLQEKMTQEAKKLGPGSLGSHFLGAS